MKATLDIPTEENLLLFFKGLMTSAISLVTSPTVVFYTADLAEYLRELNIAHQCGLCEAPCFPLG